MVGLATAALVMPTYGGSASATPAAEATPTVSQQPALSPAAESFLARARRGVCINAHLQNIGWQGWRCSRNNRAVTVGTTGQSRRLEALLILTRRTGGVCAQAHVQNVGWQRTRCARDNRPVMVGTTGQSLRLEALRLNTGSRFNNGNRICAQAHVQNVGWQRWRCSQRFRPATVGTVGQSLRLEALRVRV